jgi:hypothetical protein
MTASTSLAIRLTRRLAILTILTSRAALATLRNRRRPTNATRPACPNLLCHVLSTLAH